MVRKELMSYVGSAQQLMSVRPVVYKEGRAEGLQAYEVKNDRLSFSVKISKRHSAVFSNTDFSTVGPYSKKIAAFL